MYRIVQGLVDTVQPNIIRKLAVPSIRYFVVREEGTKLQLVHSTVILLLHHPHCLC